MSETKFNPEKLAETYLKASEAHRQRLTTLHTNEWQMAIVFWTAIAGATVVSVVNAQSLFPLPSGGFSVLATAYFLAGFAYLFGFCRTNYASLATERQRYLYFQNQALIAIGGAIKRDLIVDSKEFGISQSEAMQADMVPADNPIAGTKPKPMADFMKSAVWRFKVLSTSLVTSAGLTVAANLDRVEMSKSGLSNHLVEYVVVGAIYTLLISGALILNGRAVVELFRATSR